MIFRDIMGAPDHTSDPKLNRVYGVRRLVQDRQESTPPESNRGEAGEFDSLTRTKGTGVAVPIHTIAVANVSAIVHAVPPNLLCRSPLCGGAGAFLRSITTKRC